jgi:hypothetical protein
VTGGAFRLPIREKQFIAHKLLLSTSRFLF